MKQDNLTITIGIPAHNESKNIGKLINLLLSQKNINVDALKIIVNCDGCTDNTAEIVKGFNNNNITVMDDGERHGPGFRQNQIIDSIDSEVLVLMNADVLPYNELFIYELILPLIENRADLTSAKAIPIKATNFFQESLYYSVLMKDEVFESINNGNNIYTCRGVARGMSKTFYKNFHFPIGVAEDAYSYLYTVSTDNRYHFAKNSKVYFVLPDNCRDHRKQSHRFYISARILSDLFPLDLITKEYRYSKPQMLRALIRMALKHPIHMTFYFFMNIYMAIYSKLSPNQSIKEWETSSSTKLVNI